ncbi:MAG: bifunctional diaminohydroxyphosphoribosylaminopyrimidine deaminase/5-amino-6-(5-phosphoribosylamino)uracil reductase RibD [Fibrobacterota bacterium]|nr:bifunctional diaminohydroxyphosphoribosylaminopyrimidine deaminase/5-amino-6-(5-phosphoribosylamino)uracil reductase RibD [Fibrobacterota bacterium]
MAPRKKQIQAKPTRWSPADSRFMEIAFAEARKVKGATLPNPAVGAVLVKAGKVVGKGGTRPVGQAHAEIVALEKAGKLARGSTLYVTLEPCSHHGRTPPCTDAIIAAGVRQVVVAVKDANPLVGGKGIRALEKAGIPVRLGLLGNEAAQFYEGFFFYVAHGRPEIILKIAQSLDGSINGRPGEETTITGEEARAWAHGLRSRVDAVVITGRTLRVDNPELTPRLVKGAVSPDAVILSRRGPFSEEMKLFAADRKSKTIVMGESGQGLPAWVDHESLGEFSAKDDTLAALLALFGKRGYHSVLVEGGRELWSLFLRAGIWDRLYVLTAPKVFPEGDKWAAELGQDWGKSLKFRNLASLGSDFLTEFRRSEFIG